MKGELIVSIYGCEFLLHATLASLPVKWYQTLVFFLLGFAASNEGVEKRVRKVLANAPEAHKGIQHIHFTICSRLGNNHYFRPK